MVKVTGRDELVTLGYAAVRSAESRVTSRAGLAVATFSGEVAITVIGSSRVASGKPVIEIEATSGV